jgi:hypothetical protein
MDAIVMFRKLAARLRDEGCIMSECENETCANNSRILMHISDVIEEMIEEIERKDNK